ncbi:MAG: redox-sensing transcriptional repressor Rex, partial [Chloroflexota bacterium]
MANKPIPNIVIARLPIYLRALVRMLQQGRQVTSSQELGERLGISAAQIRKDLSQFGEFGKQGTGYNIEYLAKNIQQILKIDRIWDVAVIGAGDVGHAILNYDGFHQRGFQAAMIFDNSPEKIGKKILNFTILDIATMKEKIRAANIKIAMLAVPAEHAQSVVD